MRRNFSPLIGLLMAATLLAAVPAAFAAAPDHLPFIGSSAPSTPADLQTTPSADLPAGLSTDSATDMSGPTSTIAGPDRVAPEGPTHLGAEVDPVVASGPRAGSDTGLDDAAARPVDIAVPDVPQSIRARCIGSVDGADSGSVECNWKAREDLRIAGWQLWNLQVRPAHGERNLVAELRAGVTTYTDTAVEAPGQYLYVVLGLDANGETVARSGVAPATLESRPTHDDPMRLQCRTADSPDTSAAIGCEWSPTKAETAVGYVLWRSVGGDDRVVVARTGLDMVRFADSDVAAGHRYTYVVTAVDANGEVVGRSRPEHAGMPGPMTRPVGPVEMRPVGPVEVRPVHPVEAAPTPAPMPAPMPAPRMASDMGPTN